MGGLIRLFLFLPGGVDGHAVACLCSALHPLDKPKNPVNPPHEFYVFAGLLGATARYMMDLGFKDGDSTMQGLGLRLIAGALFTAAGAAADAATVDDVRARGALNCGVNEGLPGFSVPDPSGEWHGFDVDICRAISAAIFGAPDKVNYVAVSAAKRFDALASGEIDVLSRNSTWTMTRDATLGLDFAGIAYYDGQGFLVRADYGMRSALELVGARICVLAATTTEDNAAGFFRSRGIDVALMPFDSRAEVNQAYAEEKCDAMTADSSALAADRSQMPVPDDHVILPEIISKEPLGPVTRDDDPAWTDLVRWTLFGLINAEEQGLTASALAADAPNAETERAKAAGLGQPVAAALKVDEDWMANVIAGVGNYGEIFTRNLGIDTPLGIERGINAPWNAGGILYAPPMN
jgi:general L-amino acid transport system substrate-binding protein